MKLQDAVIAITGGAQGLGRSTAEYLAGQGARIALIDLKADTLLNTSNELNRENPDRIKPYVCNVSDEKQVEDTFTQILADFGQLDGLVNNAGVLRDALLVKTKEGKILRKMSLAEWQTVIDINLTGVFLCGREASIRMIESERPGCIINLSSIARAGNVGQSNYSAAKAGVVALTTTWAKELARYNIRSMAIAPGFIETEMTASMPDDAKARMNKIIPLNRVGQPEHIAQTVQFILENDYISGRVIEVDGALRI